MNTYQKIDTMHPVFRLVFAIALIMSGTLSVQAELFSYAYKGTELRYKTTSDHTCSVYYNSGTSGDIIIPEIAVYNGKEYSVTSIGLSAFRSCSGLTSVTIPNSVTSIEMAAFEYCSGLTSLKIPDAVTSIEEAAFGYCSGLTSIDIPNSVTEICNSTFQDCSGLTSVTIPNSVTSIGVYAFTRCSGLTSVTIPNSVTSIGDEAFSACFGLTSVTIGTSVTSIGKHSFSHCSGMTSVTIPNSVISIGGWAFYNCSSLISVTIPNSVTSISNSAFEGCSGLSSVEIGNSVTSIGSCAFQYCSGLTSVTIPNSVISIGVEAFKSCSSLTAVTMSNSITSIGGGTFDGCSITSVKINDVNNWSKIKFGDVGANPIYYAKSFTVGDSDNPVKHLDLDLGEEGVSNFAFCNAKNLETVRVKGESIGHAAFDGCSNLRQICVDVDSLSTVFFFSSSYKPESVYSLRETPPTASDKSFSKYDGVKLYVPKGCVSKYKNAPACWWRFSDINESDFSDLDSIFKADYANNEGGSGIDEIFMNNNKNEIDPDSLYEVYDLNGCKLGNSIENLAPGIYLIRQGDAQKKIAVK